MKDNKDITIGEFVFYAVCSICSLGGGLFWIYSAQSVFRSHGINEIEIPLFIPIFTSIIGCFTFIIFACAVISVVKLPISNLFYRTYSVKKNMDYNNNNLPMIFPENDVHEFNFDSLIGNNSYQTICGCPVKIDKVLRDITKTTVLGVSGTMVVKGVKIRGVWDSFGNIMECRKILCMNTPSKLFVSIDSILGKSPESIFRLVNVKQLSSTPSPEERSAQ